MSRTIKEQLQEIRNIDQLIDCKIAQQGRLRELSLSVKATDYTRDKVTGGKSDTQQTIAKMMDLQREISNDIDRLVDLKAKWINIVDTSLQGLEHSVICKYYLERKTWEQTAEALRKDYRWILRVHDHALENLRLTIESH